MSAILREKGSKYEEQKKKHKLVISHSYRVILLKRMMEWKLLEQRVDRT